MGIKNITNSTSVIVEIFKRNDELAIRKIPVNLVQAFRLLAKMPKDFMTEGRDDKQPQERNFESR